VELTYLRELDERRSAILESISQQGKLDAALKQTIEAADSKAHLFSGSIMPRRAWSANLSPIGAKPPSRPFAPADVERCELRKELQLAAAGAGMVCRSPERWFADSPLERAGLEHSVPLRWCGGPRPLRSASFGRIFPRKDRRIL